jgi:hypothetical protein
VEMEGRFSVERPTTISEHLNIVEVKCQDVDKRVLKVLKFLCTFNIRKLTSRASVHMFTRKIRNARSKDTKLFTKI